MKYKASAFLFAAALAALPCMGFSASAEPLPHDWQPPEWVPTDFASAMVFQHNYGATHIQDGMVCIVYRETNYDDLVYDIDIDGTVTAWTDWCDYPPQTYELVIPEKPAENDFDAYREWEQSLREVGLDAYYIEQNPDYKAPFRYTVYLYDTIPDTIMDVTINAYSTTETTEAPVSSETYSFETDEDRNTVEVDWRGWLPDSVGEHKQFIKDNGQLSVQQEQYIVYCADIVYDGGIDAVVTMEPEDALEEYMNYNVSDPELIPLSGGTGHHVRVFKAAKEGEFGLEIVQKQPWAHGNEFDYIYDKDTGYYTADKDGKITETDPPQPEKAFVPTTETAVAVVKYLCGQGELDAETAKNADMDKNGIINAADLAKIKQYLLSPAAKEDLILIVPKGNIAYPSGAGVDFDVAVRYSANDEYEWFVPENAEVTVYSAKTDMPVITLTYQESEANGMLWSGMMHYNVREDCDVTYYAKLYYSTSESDGENAVSMCFEIISDKVTLHFSNEENPEPVCTLNLATPWPEVGFGAKPRFTATLSDLTVDSQITGAVVTLYNYDTKKEVCKMELPSGDDPTGEHKIWSCTADIDVKIDTTKKFYAVLVAETDNADGGIVLRSDIVSIHFTKNPAP